MTVSIIRQPWVRWAIRIGSAALILYLGMTVAQLRSQQQEARGIAASTVWFTLDNVTAHVERAERHLRDGDGAGAEDALHQSSSQLTMITMQLGTYYALSPDGSAVIDGTVHNYTNEINRLWDRIYQAPTVNAATVFPDVTALRMDLARWQTTFSVDLLARGSRSQLQAAVRIFCQDLQVPQVMDLTCQAAQR